jgi:hypothetical protein
MTAAIAKRVVRRWLAVVRRERPVLFVMVGMVESRRFGKSVKQWSENPREASAQCTGSGKAVPRFSARPAPNVQESLGKSTPTETRWFM